MVTILLSIIAALNTILSVIVLVRAKKLINTLFAITSFCMAVWAVSIVVFLQTTDPVVALISAKVFYGATIIFGGLLYFLFQIFPSGGKISFNKALLVSVFCLSVLLPLVLIKSYIIGEVAISSDGNTLLVHYLSYVYFSVLFLALFYGGLYTAYKKYGKLPKRYQKQLKYYSLGLLFTSFPGLITNLLLPAYGQYKYIWIGPLFSTVFIAASSYIIAKHKLFDIRLVIARSLAYILSLSFLVGIYGGLTFWLTNNLLDEANAIVSNTFSFVLLMIVAITYAPIKRYFDKQTNRVFYRDAYDPQEFLDALNEVLVGNIEVSILARKSSEIIVKYLKSDYCSIAVQAIDSTDYRVISTDNSQLQKTDISSLNHSLQTTKSSQVAVDNLGQSQVRLKVTLEHNNIAVVEQLTTKLSTGNHQALGYLILGYKKSGSPYTDQDLRIIGIISAELLIAIQNALRFEEIQGFNATLQKKIDNATLKLQKSNRKLLALDESKDEFISMASHQLRTPLTSVKGYMSMVMEGDGGKLNKKQKDLLSQAFASSQRMVYLVADLLNVSRLKAGKFILESQPTNLAEVVSSEIEQLKQTARTKNLRLEFIKPKAFPDLLLDETKIRQVIMNFADNAIYYTPKGGKILIQLKEDSRNVYFTVKDNGIGVPKSEKSKLFTKFYRANNAKRARPDGTGLGLFMAKKVIDAQAGNLIFESAQNKGSTFGFTFNKKKLSPKNPKA